MVSGSGAGPAAGGWAGAANPFDLPQARREYDAQWLGVGDDVAGLSLLPDAPTAKLPAGGGGLVQEADAAKAGYAFVADPVGRD